MVRQGAGSERSAAPVPGSGPEVADSGIVGPTHYGRIMMNLECDGALIVREVLNSQDLRFITDTVEAAFACLDAGGGDEGMRDSWKNVGIICLANLGRCGVTSDLAREFCALLSQHADRLVGRSYLAADMCSIRQIHQKHIRLEWHTDYDGGGTWPYDPCYNIWLPLTPVGRDHPSVEIVRGSHRRMRELPLPSPHNGQFADGWVAKYFAPAAHITPELAPGDALVFHHCTLHRTQVLNRDTIGRVSIECRVTQQAAYLAALR
jgi:hypothetical protein